VREADFSGSQERDGTVEEGVVFVDNDEAIAFCDVAGGAGGVEGGPEGVAVDLGGTDVIGMIVLRFDARPRSKTAVIDKAACCDEGGRVYWIDPPLGVLLERNACERRLRRLDCDGALLAPAARTFFGAEFHDAAVDARDVERGVLDQKWSACDDVIERQRFAEEAGASFVDGGFEAWRHGGGYWDQDLQSRSGWGRF
jgi:hypothetical protein